MASELQQLREAIELEAQSLATFNQYQSVARHDFIQSRYNRLGELQEELTQHVGHDAAMGILTQAIDKAV